jgi:thymidine phosphorylase
VDARVGMTGFAQIGQRVQAGDPLANVHAASIEAARACADALQTLVHIGNQAPTCTPILIQSIS